MNEELLIKYLSGNTDNENKEEIETWINESQENLKLAEQIYFVLKTSEQISVQNSVNAVLSYQKIKNTIDSRKTKINIRKIGYALQRIAAVLFIPLIVSLVYLLSPQDGAAMQYVEVTSRPGMISTLDLPDGTKVWLNAGSTLKYPVVFSDDNRNVNLSGHAYFDVVKDSKRPFIVNTHSEYSIEVLGTEFDLSTYQDDDFIGTTLIEGSVKILVAHGDTPFERLLKVGEKAMYNVLRNELVVTNVNLDDESAWRKGHLVFNDQPMEDVFKILSRYYNVEFKIMNEGVKVSKITGNFKSDQLENVLEYLRLASDIQYKISASTLGDDNSTQNRIIEIQ